MLFVDKLKNIFVQNLMDLSKSKIVYAMTCRKFLHCHSIIKFVNFYNNYIESHINNDFWLVDKVTLFPLTVHKN